MKDVKLTNSALVAKVDDGDYFFLVNLSRWCVDANGYAITTRKPHRYMHMVLLGAAPKGFEWDHRDRDTLNNQRRNLRPADARDNNANKGLTKANKSGYKGVYFAKELNKWRAQIRAKQSLRISLGVFSDPVEAAKAYDRAAIEHFGEFAYLNFDARTANVAH